MDEEHEEKTGEIQRATHDDDKPLIKKRKKKKRTHDDDKSQDSHLDYIPFDLTLEILSRLPAKSIVRYRCVSKNWSSITILPSFIDSFGSRSSARPPRLLLSFILEDKKRYFISFPQHHNPDGSCPPFYSYHITDPIYNQNIKIIEEPSAIDNPTHTASESVHGLILFHGNRLWNPSLRRFLPLPPHPKENIETVMYKSYLGYDPSEDKHKVLSVLQFSFSDQPLVLTLGAQESWKIITKSCPMHSPLGGNGRCANGIVYYEAGFGVDIAFMMSFDVKSEKFNPPIKFPETYIRLGPTIMSSYEGKLALVMTSGTYPHVYLSIDLYILKDANGDEWTHKRFFNVDCRREWTSEIIFRGITGDGELIFASFALSESFYILYFDPKRNITRHALFAGIMGEEVRNIYRLSEPRTYNLDVFPNHIESLLYV